jgi:hypothetical protein
MGVTISSTDPSIFEQTTFISVQASFAAYAERTLQQVHTRLPDQWSFINKKSKAYNKQYKWCEITIRTDYRVAAGGIGIGGTNGVTSGDGVVAMTRRAACGRSHGTVSKPSGGTSAGRSTGGGSTNVSSVRGPQDGSVLRVGVRAHCHRLHRRPSSAQPTLPHCVHHWP